MNNPNNNHPVMDQSVLEAGRGVSPGTTTLLIIEIPSTIFKPAIYVSARRWLLLQGHLISKDSSIIQMLNVSLRFEGTFLIVTSPLQMVPHSKIVSTVGKLDPKIRNPTLYFSSVEIFLSALLTKENWSVLVTSMLGLLPR